ncbi:MAG: C40 family peptidase [Mogibacterium sp.]|nr:C40 family peptidase [Mogibacterium sp.]MBR2539207.1 C40 family peptidase [Mogibacterium sp.]
MDKGYYKVELNRKPRQVIIKTPAEHTKAKADYFGDELGKSYTRVEGSLRRNRRKVALIAGAASILIAVGGITAAAIATSLPYTVKIGGEKVVTVNGKNEAEAVVLGVVKDFAPEGAKVKAVTSTDAIKVEAADMSDKEDAVVVDDAIATVKDALAAEPEEAQVTVVSTGKEIEEFTPETVYIQDDTMLAGEAVVETEAKAGSAEVSYRYTSVNGEVTNKDELARTVLDEGVAAEIRKGTLGLPEGEDWQTYEGDPVYSDGEDLTKTALNYLGAPYKYGGKSLTNGIDCVQFIRQMYAKYGISLPNGKNALKHVGISVSYDKAQPGDIICYSNHYALYLGDGKIVHATRNGGVVVRNNAKFRKIVTVRRVVGN